MSRAGPTFMTRPGQPKALTALRARGGGCRYRPSSPALSVGPPGKSRSRAAAAINQRSLLFSHAGAAAATSYLFPLLRLRKVIRRIFEKTHSPLTSKVIRRISENTFAAFQKSHSPHTKKHIRRIIAICLHSYFLLLIFILD